MDPVKHSTVASQYQEYYSFLPDEITRLVFSFLPPIAWKANAELVCKQWKRLANESSLWERAAMQAGLPAFKSEEVMTFETVKKIYWNLGIQISLEEEFKTEKALLEKIKKICTSLNSKEIIGIFYRSTSQVNGYFKIFVIKNGMLGENFDVLEKKAARIYWIRGKEGADFGQANIQKDSFGMGEKRFDIDMESQGIPREKVIPILTCIKETLTASLIKRLADMFQS